jgi:dGTP triphosphohydrolase
MFFQSLKHGFLFRSESDFLLEEIDWFETHYLKESEFKPPFIRQFWVASKKRDPKELEEGIEWIRNELKQESGKREKETEKEVERLAQFSRELTRIFSRERVSVVILAEAGVNPLKECLKHMLSQKVYFDFEVCVLNVAEDPDIRYLIKAFYPHVKYLSWNAPNSRKFKEKMLELLCELQGDYILFLDEARLLPQDSVTQIFERVRENPKISVINSDTQWVFMRRKIFSRLDWDESQLKRKVKKMNKDDILMTLRHGFKENHRD